MIRLKEKGESKGSKGQGTHRSGCGDMAYKTRDSARVLKDTWTHVLQ